MIAPMPACRFLYTTMFFLAKGRVAAIGEFDEIKNQYESFKSLYF